MRVTVVWATPAVQDVVAVELPAGASAADAIARSGLVGVHGIDLGGIGIAVFGRRAGLATRLEDGDRVELCRPLQVEPKAARRRRAEVRPLAPSPPRVKVRRKG